MCLAIPGKLIKIYNNTADADIMGVIQRIDVGLIEEAKEGDYVLIHAGYAIQRTDEESALNVENFLAALQSEVE